MLALCLPNAHTSSSTHQQKQENIKPNDHELENFGKENARELAKIYEKLVKNKPIELGHNEELSLSRADSVLEHEVLGHDSEDGSSVSNLSFTECNSVDSRYSSPAGSVTDLEEGSVGANNSSPELPVLNSFAGSESDSKEREECLKYLFPVDDAYTQNKSLVPDTNQVDDFPSLAKPSTDASFGNDILPPDQRTDAITNTTQLSSERSTPVPDDYRSALNSPNQTLLSKSLNAFPLFSIQSQHGYPHPTHNQLNFSHTEKSDQSNKPVQPGSIDFTSDDRKSESDSLPLNDQEPGASDSPSDQSESEQDEEDDALNLHHQSEGNHDHNVDPLSINDQPEGGTSPNQMPVSASQQFNASSAQSPTSSKPSSDDEGDQLPEGNADGARQYLREHPKYPEGPQNDEANYPLSNPQSIRSITSSQMDFSPSPSPILSPTTNRPMYTTMGRTNNSFEYQTQEANDLPSDESKSEQDEEDAPYSPSQFDEKESSTTRSPILGATTNGFMDKKMKSHHNDLGIHLTTGASEGATEASDKFDKYDKTNYLPNIEIMNNSGKPKKHISPLQTLKGPMSQKYNNHYQEDEQSHTTSSPSYLGYTLITITIAGTVSLAVWVVKLHIPSKAAKKPTPSVAKLNEIL